MVLAQLSEFFKQYPYSSNAIFCLILVVLEKVAEYDFVCPCVSGYTEAFFVCYLVVPMFIAFVFGLYLLSFECRCQSSCANFKKFVACLLPSFVWLALFFCDGRYVACWDTELKSKQADSEEMPPWEWCSKSRNLTADQYNAKKAFFKSKLIGFGVLCFFSLISLFNKCCKNCGCCHKLSDKLVSCLSCDCWTKCCEDCEKWCGCLDPADKTPCCSDYRRTCGSAHCKRCCNKHPRDCCPAHQQTQCLAHPPKESKKRLSQGSSSECSEGWGSSSECSEDANAQSSQGGSGAREENTAPINSAVKPCDNKSCPCLCHQTCDCDCHT